MPTQSKSQAELAPPINFTKLKPLFRLSPDQILGLSILFILGLLVLLPMLMVVLQPVLQWVEVGSNAVGLGEIFQRRLWMASLQNSLYLSVGAGLLGGVMGAMLAIARHSYRFPGSRYVDLIVWCILIIPSFVIAQGWVLFASRSGISTQLTGSHLVSDLVFNPNGLVLIMAMKNFPLAYLAMSAALQWSMKNLSLAGRLCGRSAWQVFFTVRIPLLLPALLSGIVLVFIDTIGDFGLPAALATSYRYPTLPYTIYAAINHSPIRFDLAGILATYLAIIMFVALFIYFWILRARPYQFLSSQSGMQETPIAPYPKMLAGGVWLFLLVAVGIPIGTSFMVSFMGQLWNGFFIDNFSLDNYVNLFHNRSLFAEGLKNAIAIAGQSSILSAILAFLAAYLLTFTNNGMNKIIDTACTLSMAIPGVILGVGFIFVWNSPWLSSLGLNLYGKSELLVLASTATSVPVAVRILMGAMAQIPISQLNAARLQGASLIRRLHTIVMPLVLTALISATLSGFGSSIFELAINSMLRPPKFEMLAPFVSAQFDSGEYGISTAAVFVAGTVAAMIIAVCNALLRRHFGHLIKE
ncbi:iron ABC transporter permease [Photobacterium sp. ZSDE20]|uniref:Iron ABC transporter permease n=1 Tax=Photobacterium pectinilyticum TaxID=2906793 RepID=A0ABT1N6Z6_9GAMM|nr:iron ABC transporter permease [Photobacterium sp. ZSDE20]MCQ1059609.1 iron ABC transporter permease [Photobacterium sp. ZSDE20]MDD1828956.1 iron ABC transporter permease [Photobacterium sp. ZSDE20]